MEEEKTCLLLLGVDITKDAFFLSTAAFRLLLST
jgi:hypothetical protein